MRIRLVVAIAMTLLLANLKRSLIHTWSKTRMSLLAGRLFQCMVGTAA